MKLLFTIALTLVFVTGKCQDGSLKFQSYQKMTAYLDRDGNFKLSGGWEPSKTSIVFNTKGGNLKITKSNSTDEFVSIIKTDAYKESGLTMSVFSAEDKAGGNVRIRILIQDTEENLFKKFSYLYIDYKSSVDVYQIIMEK